MVQLIITEKPSAAQKIATALADKKPKKLTIGKVPYYELTHKNKKILVVCAVGHLYSVTEKEKQGMKYPTFDLTWKPAYEAKKASAYTKPYLDVIEKLSKQADHFIVATDYDIEGEVIGLNIIKYLCKQKDASRMKYSTLTKDELIESYEKAQKHLDWGQAEAGETRHFMDFMWGINISRALTVAIKKAGMFKILSAGRVQGPALKLLADREKEIKKFKPKPFWEIELQGKIKTNTITAQHKKEKFWDKKEADKVMKATKGKPAFIKDVKASQFTQAPPAPFDLTSLQMEAYRTLGFSPKQTQALAQELYTAGYISYPRTSSQKLPPSLNLKKILQNLSKQPSFKKLAEGLLSKDNLRPNEGAKTDPAHSAVHPTGEVPKKLDPREKRLYDLIVHRFLATFGEPAKRETITLEIDVNKELFITKGTRTIEKGWHTLYGSFLKLKEETLPEVQKQDEVKVKKIEQLAKETQPPKRFTPASIIKELEKRNLGTKATRANILDSLYERSYIEEKSIKVTDLGLETISVLEKYSPEIVDEELTRDFEKQMDQIREKKYKEKQILEKAEKLLTKILKDFKKHEEKVGKELRKTYIKTREEESDLGPCKICKNGRLKIMYSPKNKQYFVACTNEDCKKTYSLPARSLIKSTDKVCEHCGFPMVSVIRKGKRPQIVCINPDCPIKKAERKLAKKVGEKCPKCKEGELVLRTSVYGAFYGCSKFPKCFYTERIVAAKKETKKKK